MPLPPLNNEPNRTGPGNTPRPKPPFWKNPWLLGLLFGLVTVTSLRPCMRRVPQAPPVGANIGTFSLIDQEGRPFTQARLQGQVWIAGVFDTSAPPATSVLNAFVKLQALLLKERKTTRLLAISNDAQFDTPAKLKALAQQQGLDLSRVTLLTGSAETMKALASGHLRPIREFDPPPPSFPQQPPPAPATGNATEKKKRPVRPQMASRPLRYKPLVILDRGGNLRGHYAIDRWGLDEALFRSVHVAEAK